MNSVLHIYKIRKSILHVLFQFSGNIILIFIKYMQISSLLNINAFTLYYLIPFLEAEILRLARVLSDYKILF